MVLWTLWQPDVTLASDELSSPHPDADCSMTETSPAFLASL